MRVIVVGATGNMGTSATSSLAADPRVSSILGLARRLPGWQPEKTEWAQADITSTDLVPLLRGADAVVHLAWILQPSHQPAVTWAANVGGTERLLRAVGEAGVPTVVYASSVGAYSPGPKDRAVSESWPTHSWPTAAYGREKAYVERLLDGFSAEHPSCRVVRLRPGFVFKTESANGQRRLFAGPLLPGSLAQPRLIPFVPDFPGLRFQVVHSDDVGEAIRLAVTGGADGPFNIAADPVIDAAELARMLGSRAVRIPASAARAALAAAWHLHLVPADPYLFDLLVRMPVMSTERARTELGWAPRYTATETIEALLNGLRSNAGMDTPPLAVRTSGPGRSHELGTGVGERP